MEEITFELTWVFHEDDPDWVLDFVKRDLEDFAECEIIEIKTPEPGNHVLTCKGILDNIICLVAQIPWNTDTVLRIDGKSMWLDDLEALKQSN